MVWAFEHASDEDRERLREIYAPRIRATDGAFAPDIDPLLGDAEVAEVIAILERSGARKHAEGEARRTRDRALATVAALPIAPERRAELASLIETSIAV